MIGRNIMVIDKYFRLYLKDSLKAHQMNTAEGLVLLVLYGQEGLSQDDLIDELQYDKGVMARTMKALEAKGMVTKLRNEADLRSANYSLTPQAAQFRPVLIDLLIAWSDRMINGLSVEELAIADRALCVMAQNSVGRVD